MEADAARVDFARLAADAPGGAQAGRVAVAGNLPYHLTSPILFSLLDQAGAVSRAVLLLQREVAERLAASPGTKDWGLLSVLLQQRGEVEIDRIVPRGAFHPPPRVDSAVVRIDLHGREPRAADARALSTLGEGRLRPAAQDPAERAGGVAGGAARGARGGAPGLRRSTRSPRRDPHGGRSGNRSIGRSVRAGPAGKAQESTEA